MVRAKDARWAVLFGEDVPGVEVVRFEKFTAQLIAVVSTPGF